MKINRRKILIAFCLIFVFTISIVACSGDTVTTVQTPDSKDDKVSLTYIADFYNNFGGRWLSVEGKSFSIDPNKVKTYYYDSNGDWTL